MNPYRDDPLYRECIPTKPSGTPNTLEGPSLVLMELEREQLLWELAHDEDEAVA